MPLVEVNADAVIVTDADNRTEFEIIDERPPNIRFTSHIMDADGCGWTTAWVQVQPNVLEAYAWSTDPRRHLSRGAAATVASNKVLP